MSDKKPKLSAVDGDKDVTEPQVDIWMIAVNGQSIQPVRATKASEAIAAWEATIDPTFPYDQISQIMATRTSILDATVDDQ